MHDHAGVARRSVELNEPGSGVAATPAETALLERARRRLADGPSDAVPLIEYVCQMPGAPRIVAEQMALALFGDRPEFERAASGAWRLARPAPDAGAAGRTAPALDGLSWVVVDVETTGMSPWGGDRVTEVAAVLVRGGTLVDRFQTLVNPERPIPPMITALTRIDAAMVRDAPRFPDVCEQLLRFLRGHVFVAHNAEFDWRFLSAEISRATGRTLTGPRLCTVRLARRLLPQLRSRRLDSLARFYDVEIADRHRALGDAEATARILLRFLAALRERECRDWAALELLLGQRAAPRRPGRAARAMPRPASDDGAA